MAGASTSRGWAPHNVVAKFCQGPSIAGYNALPVPRVTGEDHNGDDGERRQELQAVDSAEVAPHSQGLMRGTCCLVVLALVCQRLGEENLENKSPVP